MDLQKSTVKSDLFSDKVKRKFKNIRVQQVCIGVLMFIIVYSLVATSIAPKKYNLKVGDVATTDIPSPKEVVNDVATQKLIDEAVQGVQKVYGIDVTVQASAIKNLNDFFSKVQDIKSSNIDEKAKFDKLKSESNLKNLADDDYTLILKTTPEDLMLLQDSITGCLAKVYSQKISDDEKDLKSKRDDFSYAMRDYKLNKDLRELGINIGIDLIKPNLIFDSKSTDEKIKDARSSVQPIKIKKGQKIIGKNEVVNEEQYAVLKSLGLLEDQKKIDFLLYIGVGILVLLLQGLVIAYIYRYSPGMLNESMKMLLVSLISLVELLFVKFISAYGVSGYLIPAAFASMLVSILLKPRLSIVLNIALATLATFMTGYNVDIFIVAVVGGSVGAIATSKTHQRNDILTAGLIVSLANALLILGIGLISSTDIGTVFKQSLLGIINGGLSAVLALGVLPFCESAFDIVTPMKMLELSNPNQPLLKKLLFDAPGTYHHSIIVGNLAEAAVDAIGGNSLLARVGSYYHDIGKLKRPYFFMENQLTNDNPHDKITPSLSTLIITSHIKDGVELAKKYKLPTLVKDMIEQHHGTTLVKYFYIKAVNETDSHGEVTEMQFRYEGPRPRMRETAVVMLADSVEAAVRSINSPTKSKIEEMVRKIIKDKVDDGQLDECDLTLRDVNKITSTFLKVLDGIYHDRLEYPDAVNDKGGDNNDPDDRQ